MFTSTESGEPPQRESRFGFRTRVMIRRLSCVIEEGNLVDGAERAGANEISGVVPQRLRAPRARPDQLLRGRLVDMVTQCGTPIVVVQAGAGFGKSTLLAQVMAADSRPSGWLTLDPVDDDPVVLVRHLVGALDHVGMDVSAVLAALSGPAPDLRRVVLPLLAAAVEARTEPFLLFFDDMHVLSHDDSVNLANELLRLLPSDCTVVLAGRALPEMRLARQELEGMLTRLDESDLAFTPDEAHHVLGAALPDLPAGLEREVMRVTLGWPAGLHLAILALRDHPDPPVVIDGLLRSDRRVVNYLHQEGLARLDPDVSGFLTDISVLSTASGPLCDEVTGRSDSAKLLQQLVASGNLFVSPIGDGADVYRIHHLFSELLVGELRRTDPARESELRLRAARWFDGRGDADEAVTQALAARDFDLAAQVVFRHHAGVILQGETATLRRWLDSFPGEIVASDGLLALAAGWSAMLDGDRRSLVHHLASARINPTAEPLPDGTVSHAVAVAALEQMAALDGLAAAGASAAVVAAAGPTGSPWWHVARLQSGLHRSAVGGIDPIEEFTSIVLDTRGAASVHAVATAHLSLAHLRAGNRDEADRLIRAALDELADRGLMTYGLTGIVHCAGSLVAACIGDDVSSRRRAGDAELILTLTRQLNQRAAILTRQLLAEAAIVRGEPGVAARLLPAARAALADEKDATALAATQNELEARLRTLRAHPEVQDLTNAELRVIEQLPTHRSLEEIGEHLYVSRNTVKTHTLSIYRKLGVSSRGEAVARARELDLIDG